MNNKLALTWTSGPDSWDPLDFDLGNNIHMGRMLYSSPFEISKNGSLASTVLESFNMSEDGLSLSLTLAASKKFEDGSAITSKDLVIAILRMAQARPEFPVISSIVGLQEWLKLPVPLLEMPSGMSIEGNTVRIRFSAPERQALFRLSLEVFAIIPLHCIDLKTSKLTCEHAPESGRYKLKSKTVLSPELKSIEFVRRDEYKDCPEKVEISYIDKKDTEAFLKQNPGAIVHTSDLNQTAAELDTLKANHPIFETAKSWFGVIVLSRYSELFEYQSNRKIFSDLYRQNLATHKQDIPFDVETSVFTAIMPGYVPPDMSYTVDIQKFNSTKKKLRWVSRGVTNDAVLLSLNETCEQLGVVCEKIEMKEYKAKDFNAGEIDLIIGKTGFWAKDPLGDLKMLLTPNLHQDLKSVWSNQDLITKIQNLEYKETQEYSQDLQKINNLLKEDCTFNVFAHFQYYYATDSLRTESLKWIPQTVLEPHPWQLFDD